MVYMYNIGALLDYMYIYIYICMILIWIYLNLKEDIPCFTCGATRWTHRVFREMVPSLGSPGLRTDDQRRDDPGVEALFDQEISGNLERWPRWRLVLVEHGNMVSTRMA